MSSKTKNKFFLYQERLTLIRVLYDKPHLSIIQEKILAICLANAEKPELLSMVLSVMETLLSREI